MMVELEAGEVLQVVIAVLPGHDLNCYLWLELHVNPSELDDSADSPFALLRAFGNQATRKIAEPLHAITILGGELSAPDQKRRAPTARIPHRGTLDIGLR
jgi:hypothetical protein